MPEFRTIPTPNLAQIDPKYLIRFLHKQVTRESGCIEWAGTPTTEGYGNYSIEGKTYLVHRIAYVLAAGEDIPPGLTIDHKCCNKICVNPDHLTIEPAGRNVQLGYERGGHDTNINETGRASVSMGIIYKKWESKPLWLPRVTSAPFVVNAIESQFVNRDSALKLKLVMLN